MMRYCPGALLCRIGWFWLTMIVQEDHSGVVEGLQQQQLFQQRPSMVGYRRVSAQQHHPLHTSVANSRHTFAEQEDSATSSSSLITGADAKLTAGESWIRMPVVPPNDFAVTAVALERLLVEMFTGGRSRGDSFEDNVILGVGAVTSSGGSAPGSGNVRTTSDNAVPPDQQVDWSWSCILPAVDHAHVSVKLIAATNLLVLSMNATDAQDFGWVCSQFYERRHQLTYIIGVDCIASLRKIVAMFFNELPPERGMQARYSAWSQRQVDQFEKSLNGRSLMQTLDETGYIVMDGAMDTVGGALPPQHELYNSLESLLLELTDQGDLVRTDRVLFVSAKMATACGLGSANTFLRGIAHYLNQEQQQQHQQQQQQQQQQQHTLRTPIGITDSVVVEEEEELLTLPDRLQFAEYGHRDFYKVRCGFCLSYCFIALTLYYLLYSSGPPG
jgi:hypothetical protein